MGSAVIAGITMYFMQVYAFYDTVPDGGYTVQLTSVATGELEPILAENVQAIDADSSPLRFRACFTTTHSQAMLTESFVVYDSPDPLTAPRWFDCYDAATVGEALKNEQAIAYLAQENVHDGVDRVVAVFDDGRAFAWHQLNEKYKN
ncbi:MAG: DUF6446 family protein [Rhodobacter sp.]|nr:DUF6446 family protein [Rhodobacter sp.]